MKREENNQRKAERRGNILDVSILMVLVAALVTGGYRYWERRQAQAKSDDTRAEVVFTIRNADISVAQALTAGELLYFEDGSTLFGVLNTDDEPDLNTVFHAEASDDIAESGEETTASAGQNTFTHYTLRGKAFCNGTEGENGCFYLHGDTPLVAGKTFTLQTDRVSFELVVENVTICR